VNDSFSSCEATQTRRLPRLVAKLALASTFVAALSAFLPASALVASGTASSAAAEPAALASIPGPWAALGSDGAGGPAINGTIHAVAVSGTDIYVGGSFTNAGGHASVNFLAKWDGFTWSAVGAPGAFNDQVDAIVISGSNIYVGGRFTNVAGNAKADYLAKWNGSTWSALGSNVAGTDGALNHWVQAIAVSGTALYAGGFFTDAGGAATADFVAKWNGAAWSGIGSDGAGGGAIAPTTDTPSPAVFSLAVSGTDLYVGGVFSDVAGIVEADSLAKWNGSAWSALGSGNCNTGCGAIPGPAAVYALAVSGTDLYVGGAFDNVAESVGSPRDNVVKWNGSTWSALGSNGTGDGALGAPVYALAMVGTDLYVGGDFYDAADIATADRLARWDGAAWHALGSGGPDGGAISGDVNALASSPSGADLYVGGQFTDTAGIATADYLSLWGPPVVVGRPDGLIRLGASAYVGSNVYNTTSAGQSRIGSAPRGHTITFGISIQDDGTNADAFTVKATGASTTKYSVRYYRGATDITTAVVAGTYATPSLAVGASFAITAKVLVKSTATTGSSVTRLVTLTSVADSAKRDAVKLIGKRS
jgi:hypothetical protein